MGPSCRQRLVRAPPSLVVNRAAQQCRLTTHSSGRAKSGPPLNAGPLGGGAAAILAAGHSDMTQDQLLEIGSFLERRVTDLRANLAGVADVQPAAVEPPSKAVRVSELLEIYRRRAEHLLRFDSEHATRLRADTLELCSKFERMQEAMCNIWRVRVNERESLLVFEGSNTRTLLGVLHVVDARSLTPEDRRTFWGATVSDPSCPNCGAILADQSINSHQGKCLSKQT